MPVIHYKTMRLTNEPPTAIATQTRKAWTTLFETYGFSTFSPIDARATLIYSDILLSINKADSIIEGLVSRGFAVAPAFLPNP